MKKIVLTLAAALSAVTFYTGAAKADCGEVTITQMDWASSIVVTEVSKFLMTEGYGCTVTAVPSATNPAVTSLAETGKPDIVTEIWVKSAPGLQKLRDAGKVVVATEVLVDGGEEGWWVPKYVVDANPKLATLEGILANPKLVGNRFHNCPDGWGCKTINGNIAKAAGLEAKGIEIFVHGSGETMATSIASAYTQKAPWFGYYWAPTPLLGKYPMVKVDLGPYKKKVHDCNVTKECATPGISAYPKSEVLTVVTAAFKEKNPAIFELMSKVSFTNAQMGEVLAWQKAKTASPKEAAVHFLTTYKKVWGAWLNNDAREKLAPLLK